MLKNLDIATKWFSDRCGLHVFEICKEVLECQKVINDYLHLYSLLLEDGPVLAFNKWNDMLTQFVDPVYP